MAHYRKNTMTSTNRK